MKKKRTTELTAEFWARDAQEKRWLAERIAELEAQRAAPSAEVTEAEVDAFLADPQTEPTRRAIARQILLERKRAEAARAQP